MKSHPEDKLKIEYTGDLDPKFDAAMEKLVSQYGWHSTGSGYDLITETRDLGFGRDVSDYRRDREKKRRLGPGPQLLPSRTSK